MSSRPSCAVTLAAETARQTVDSSTLYSLTDVIDLWAKDECSWPEVTDAARLARETLVMSRWHRRRDGRQPQVGGTRRLPRWMYAELKRLARLPAPRSRVVRENVKNGATRLRGIAERIISADRQWARWERGRAERCAPFPLPPEPDWRYPTVRVAYFAIRSFCSLCEELARDLFNAPPGVDLRSGMCPSACHGWVTWHVVLGRKWSVFVADGSYSGLHAADSIHLQTIAIRDMAFQTRAAICAASPELDDVRAPVFDRETTKLITSLQEVMTALPMFPCRSEAPRPDPAGVAAEIRVTLAPLRHFLRRLSALVWQIEPSKALTYHAPLPRFLSEVSPNELVAPNTDTSHASRSIAHPTTPPPAATDHDKTPVDALKARLHLLSGNQRYLWDVLEHKCLSRQQAAKLCGYTTPSQAANDVGEIRKKLGGDSIRTHPIYGYYRPDAEPDWSQVPKPRRRSVRTTR